MPEFQIIILAARTNVKLTQQEMAEKLGIDRTSYIKYEKGEVSMRMDTATKFSEIVKIPMPYIDFSLAGNTAKSGLDQDK